MKRLLMLRKVPLFAHMTLDQLEAINHLVHEVDYLSHEVIIREGDIGSELYILVDGSVDVVKGMGTSQEIRLATLSSINYFGEMAILDDEPRSATVVANTDSHLLSLAGENLKELVHEMPEIAFEIFRILTQRVRRSEQLIRTQS